MIKPLITQRQKDEYYYKDTYLCKVDMDQKRTHKFKGENGEEFKLFIPIERVLNHRLAHPNYGVIATATEGCQFKPGTELIVRHFTFEDEGRRPLIFYTDEQGVDYYKAQNFDVMFGIVDGELVCREGVLLCEGVEGKLVDTELEVLREHEGRRRDIAKVLKVWEGCTEYQVGDYVLLERGADYAFTHEGVEYLKVDHYFNDVLAVVDSPEWRIQETRLHVTDHGEKREF